MISPVRGIVGAVAVCAGFAGPARAQCDSEFEQLKVTASDGAPADHFGNVVSLSGDVALIGADADDDNGTNSGSVYVCRYNGQAWVEDQKLLAQDGEAFDRFGSAVDVSGNVAVVGAWGNGEAGSFAGAAYVYRYNGASWQMEQKLMASNASVNDSFGFSVAVDGDVVAVGAYTDNNWVDNGSVYVFRFNGSSWVEEAQLLASDEMQGDLFGNSLDVSGDAVLVGAFHNDDHGWESGAAYVFRHQGGTWSEEAKLLAPDGAMLDLFGCSVSIDGDVAVIGAYNDGSAENGVTNGHGAAYVFRRDGGSWQVETKLLPDVQGMTSARFGHSVSVSGNRVAVGSHLDDDIATDSGAVYTYRFDGAGWGLEEKMYAGDGEAYDSFGQSVAVSGSHSIFGAYKEDSAGIDSGSSYMVDEVPSGADPGADCNENGVSDACDIEAGYSIDQNGNGIPDECEAPSPDLNSDGVVNVLDLVILIGAWGECQGACPADLNSDGAVDVVDVILLVDLWG